MVTNVDFLALFLDNTTWVRATGWVCWDMFFGFLTRKMRHVVEFNSLLKVHLLVKGLFEFFVLLDWERISVEDVWLVLSEICNRLRLGFIDFFNNCILVLNDNGAWLNYNVFIDANWWEGNQGKNILGRT